jgi:hypothetical protein
LGKTIIPSGVSPGRRGRFAAGSFDELCVSFSVPIAPSSRSGRFTSWASAEETKITLIATVDLLHDVIQLLRSRFRIRNI